LTISSFTAIHFFNHEIFLSVRKKGGCMNINKKEVQRAARLLGAFVVVFLLIVYMESGSQGATNYPTRDITLVIPYPPGGVTDLGARALANAMEKHLKKPVVATNKPGGGTTVAGNAVATAKPDGYTLGLFPSSTSIPEVYTYFYEAPYSSRDLKPICRIFGPVLAIVVKGDSPLNSLKDLVDFARRSPNAKYATHTRSSLGYVVMRGIAKAENVDFLDVPFEGDSKIVPALLGGHVPFGTPAYPAIKSLLDAKQLKALALLIEKRADFAPDTPTIVELGYKLPIGSYLGVFAPKGTPNDIVKKINDVVAKISEEADFRSKINGMGTQLIFEDTESFEKLIKQYKENLRVFFKEEGLVK
jgi:tripartite-type tricarboxylate transporter receptor subunit TctC